jgi:hypothetical protein
LGRREWEEEKIDWKEEIRSEEEEEYSIRYNI